MTTSRTLHALKEYPGVLRGLIADVPRDALDWRPRSWEGIPSEHLTIRQQVCHIRDIETDGYHVRFSRMLRETEPVLDSIDTYLLATERNYDAANLEAALDDFETARAETMSWISRLSPKELARRGSFEGYGPVTVKSLIHYLSSHDQQHLAGIEWLLGQFAACQSA
jgi:hypothetical protein